MYPMMGKAPVAILIGPKGRGSNMLALAASCEAPDFPARIVAVVSPKENIPSVQAAQERGLPVRIVTPEAPGYAARLLDALKEAKFVCLAGYLRLLPAEVLAAFPGRVLNVHPALLPKFGGKGMYGMRVHEAVLAAGETESGCTVHRVTEAYDEGPPVVQLRCPVLPNDTPEELALRVLRLEHQAFSQALRQVIEEEHGA
jgi:phosphoribosylglycinamide formyltransferase 1